MGRQRGAGLDPREDPAVDKACAVCGRMVTWRRAWREDWAQVRYCSDGCRRRGLTDADQAVEKALRELLARRAAGATVCPSEAARAAGSEQEWRHLMEPARAAARRLVAAGEAEVLQGGRVVDPSTAHGPIRVRRS